MRYILILFLAFNLYAHSLKVFTSTDEKNLYIKSYYSASSACRNCKVTITTFENKTINKKTDDKGKLTIPLSLKPIKILVDGALGHQKSVDIEHNFSEDDKYPFWLKMIFAFGGMGVFFTLFWLFKRK